MAQSLKALAALAEDQGLFPHSHVALKPLMLVPGDPTPSGF